MKIQRPSSLMRSNNGFSLVEVLVVAAIMGAMALVGMNLFQQQTKSAADVDKRFEMIGLINELKLNLYKEKTCTENFKGLSPFNADDRESVTSLKKYFGQTKDNNGDMEDVFKESFQTSDYSYGNTRLKIAKYELDIEEDLDEDKKSITLPGETPYGEIYLAVTIDKGENSIGARQLVKKIKLNIVVDLGTSDKKIISCTASSSTSDFDSGTGGKITTIDSIKDEKFKGMSGSEACAIENKSCSYVQSTNYLKSSAGSPEIGHVCASSYNTKLTGMNDGSPMPNIHSCSMELGPHETYKISSGTVQVVCAGIFVAFCQ